MTPSCRILCASLLVLALAGCCSSPACDPEQLPQGGAITTPEDVLHLARYTIEHDCRSEAYDLLSAHTRDGLSYLEFIVVWGHKEFEKNKARLLRGVPDPQLTFPHPEQPDWLYLTVDFPDEPSESFLIVPAEEGDGDPPRRYGWGLREQYPEYFNGD